MNPFYREDESDDDDLNDYGYNKKSGILSRKTAYSEVDKRPTSKRKKIVCGCCACIGLSICLLLIAMLVAGIVLFMFVKNGKLGHVCELVLTVESSNGIEPIFQSIRDSCERPPFQLLSSEIHQGDPATATIECTHTSAKFKFVDNVTVVLEPTASQQLVRVRGHSISRIGKYDLGQNYKNLKKLWSYAKLKIDSQDRIEGCWFPYN